MNGRRAVLGGVVVLAAVAAGYLFWKNCVVALKPSHGDDASLAKGPVRAATARSGRIDRGLISLYFEDWGIRFKEGEIVRTPARLTANAPVKLALAISQNNAVGVKITYVLVAFSTNAEGYPGAGNRGRSCRRPAGRTQTNMSPLSKKHSRLGHRSDCLRST